MEIKKIRVFVAVDLSEETRKELGKFVKKLSSKRWPVRWEKDEKLHITLFFVGWIDPLRMNFIKKAIEKGVRGIGRFSIKIGKLGVFPDFVQPRVIWIGIKGEQAELVKLQRLVSSKLVAAGFEAEERKWIPHLTIGRVDRSVKYRAKKELGRQLSKLEIPVFEEDTLINNVVVYESKLYSTGSEYKKHCDVDFTG